jgi:hypothetical protein
MSDHATGHISTGLRIRATIGTGKRIYVMVDRDLVTGRPRATWTMPAENRRADYLRRRISPDEAREIKQIIRSLLAVIPAHATIQAVTIQPDTSLRRCHDQKGATHEPVNP